MVTFTTSDLQTADASSESIFDGSSTTTLDDTVSRDGGFMEPQGVKLAVAISIPVVFIVGRSVIIVVLGFVLYFSGVSKCKAKKTSINNNNSRGLSYIYLTSINNK